MKIDGLDRLISQLQTACGGGLKAEYQDWLEDMGLQFLDIIQDELIKENAVDTGRLLRSFTQGDKENLFSFQKAVSHLKWERSLNMPPMSMTDMPLLQVESEDGCLADGLAAALNMIRMQVQE